MSSYYPSFNYMGLNSLKDKKLIVVHFDNGDDGEMETFLSMESVYTETAYGTRRHDYGAKYDDVARPKISVMKMNGTDFTVAEVRDFLRWTTGARNVSYLDMLEADTVKFSFLGRVVNVLQHKLDARTVGFTIEFESTSPWAWSPQQRITKSFSQEMVVDSDGTLVKKDLTLFNVDENGILSSNVSTRIDDDGILDIGNMSVMNINNQSDDLYNYTILDTTFTNNNSDYISIKNITLDEETIITGMKANEIIKLSSGQFIISDVPYKLFGNTFNFVWPRLAPGINQFIIDGSGRGSIEFTYRYPIKIGDCAIDIDIYNGDVDCGCSDNNGGSGVIYDSVEWDDILNKPNTIEGYGITDAYTTIEVDEKLKDVDMDINATDLNNMLSDILGN